jgi:hypothetical protein
MASSPTPPCSLPRSCRSAAFPATSVLGLALLWEANGSESTLRLKPNASNDRGIFCLTCFNVVFSEAFPNLAEWSSVRATGL